MSTANIDYRSLVLEIEPKAIHSKQQYEYYLAKLQDLDSRWDLLLSPERDMHELLSLLIADYEKKTVNIQAPTPIEAIETLMEANGLKQKDLIGVVFETASVASEVLSGKRELTKDHVRKLAKRFEVQAELFL